MLRNRNGITRSKEHYLLMLNESLTINKRALIPKNCPRWSSLTNICREMGMWTSVLFLKKKKSL